MIGNYRWFMPIIALVLILPLNKSRAENGFVWESFKPNKASSPIKVMVMGKRLNYYPLVKGSEILVTVEGPTRLRVISRIEFGKDVGGEKSYYLRALREDNKKEKFRRVSTASSSAVLADNPAVRLGVSRSAYIKVPAGKHTYRFYVGSKAAYRLYLRFYERKASVDTGAENVAFAPSKFTTSVPIVVKEEEIIYYRIGGKDSLKFSIIGPTTLKVISRLEFDPSMIAEQKFRIRVLEDGEEKHVYPLRSKPSEVAEYRELTTKIAGSGSKFFIEVPRGKHEYDFEVLDNGRNVLLRFFIPRKDLMNNL